MSRRPYARPDHHTKAAKAQGFPARSVFKLEDIDRRCRLLRPNQRVIDLGAAPGSWSRYVADKIGPRGSLLSVDLSALDIQLPPHVMVLEADAFTLPEELHRRFGPYDVVLSDMAPKTSGDKFQNAAQSYALFVEALGVAERFGAVGCHFVGKLFMGSDFEQARERVRSRFARTQVMRPPATRKNSVEVFLVGLERHAPVAHP
jgi:23S rRNA (uridine2552-2'-O)-methyltransferase